MERKLHKAKLFPLTWGHYQFFLYVSEILNQVKKERVGEKEENKEQDTKVQMLWDIAPGRLSQRKKPIF